jgi:hypothetical protein
MTLSPTERRQMLDIVADRLVSEIRAEVGDLSAYVVLPLATASQLLGLSTKQLAKVIPITRTGHNKQGVQLSAIKAHITKNTK